MTLAGLSYTGDFRMVIGEDRNKVANIVRPNLEAFRRLFASRLAALNNYVEVVPELARGDQDTSSAARHFHLNQLPKTLQWNLVKVWPISWRTWVGLTLFWGVPPADGPLL